MTILRLALGLAAAAAAAVVYSNNRSRLRSGDGDSRSQPGMGSTPGTDRWDSGSSGMGTSEDRGGRDTDFADLRGSSGMGAAGRTMSGSDTDAVGFGSDTGTGGSEGGRSTVGTGGSSTGSSGNPLGRNTGAL